MTIQNNSVLYHWISIFATNKKNEGASPFVLPYKNSIMYTGMLTKDIIVETQVPSAANCLFPP